MSNPAISLSEAQEMLSAWKAAELAIAGSGGVQSYSIGTRQLSKADAGLIGERISYWQAMVTKLNASPTGGLRVRKSAPIFD